MVFESSVSKRLELGWGGVVASGDRINEKWLAILTKKCKWKMFEV